MSDDAKQRTTLQNRSLHKYCSLMADSMDAAGYEQRAVLDKLHDDFQLPWTMEAVKNIFRQVAHILYPNVESTADLTTTQITEVHRIVDAKLAEITGITHPWPSLESQMMEEYVPGEDREEEHNQPRKLD